MIKVLIIEDEPLIVNMYQKALDVSEFEVSTATNGLDGLEIAKTMKPDIILLDIMMPEPNGIQVLESLKADESTKAIQVVMLTSLSGEYDVSLAISKGAVAYWVKTEIKLDSLGGKIKAVLKR